MKAVSASTNRLGNRNNNQDRCLTLLQPERALLVVADGMGGHARGDLAAQTTVESLSRSFLSCPGPIRDPEAFLLQALNHAHLAVVDAGHAQQPPVVPRTTCVVCLLQGAQAWWAHLGDSRLYLVRAGSVFTRTRDHTPVEELVQQGTIDEDAIRTHPMRNTVSRCLGGSPALPKITLGQACLEAGDTLLLCSDGLWSAVSEDRLCDLPEDGSRLEQRVNQLADEADVATYPQSDNITLVALRWLAAADTVDTAPETPTMPEHPDAEPPADTDDPVQQAIEEIHRAMLEYGGEMKK